MSLELSAGSWRCRSSPAGWRFISKLAVSLHSCLQAAVWCWHHPHSPVPLALLEDTQADGPGACAGAAPQGQRRGGSPGWGRVSSTCGLRAAALIDVLWHAQRC